jgi:DNA-binding CsgD family transcriptional regulator
LYNPEGALSFHEESLNTSRSAGDSLGMIAALNDLAWVALRQANYEQADRLGQQSLALGRTLADAHSIAASLLVLGSVAFPHRHTYEQARSFLEESLLLRRILDERSGCAHVLHLLGYLAVFQGEYARVIPLIMESTRLRQEEENTQGIGMNLLVLAELAVAQKQPHRAVRLLAAEQRLREAIGFPEFGLPAFNRERIEWLQMSTRAQLGEATFIQMWAEGRDMELAQLLTYAFEADAEAGEPVRIEPEQVSTHEPLLSVPPSAASVQAPTLLPDGLTARELDVLRLLAQGLTSPQIAKQLVIGVVTVNFHVRSIYSKLGVSSRSAATRYAIEHKLV